jgi:hypothetical protein
MSVIDDAEKQKRIVSCIYNALETNLGKNVAKTLFFRFQSATGLDSSDGLYNSPDSFMSFLRTTIPSAAPMIETAIINGIRSSFMLPREKAISSLSEAITLAKIPAMVKGDVRMDEVEARIVKCVQYALRDTFSEATVQIIFGKFESTTNLGLRSVATRPDAFLTFLKSLFGPAVKNIEHVFMKELISEFSEDVDLRPTNFADTVSRLRMHFLEREMDWGN